jgi:esterase/lipase superfamily enzyme
MLLGPKSHLFSICRIPQLCLVIYVFVALVSLAACSKKYESGGSASSPSVSAPPPSPPPPPASQTSAIEEEKNYAVVRVFYATDRRPTGQTTPANFYSSQRAQNETLSRGTLDVSIPAGHKEGIIERPSILRLEFREDPKKHFVLLNVSPKKEDEFLRELSGQVDISAGKEAFVFIHGYDTTFQAAAWRTAQLAYDLGFRGVPILYTWPSKGTVAGYPVDEATIEWTTPHLKSFLEQIATESHAKTIHLIAHSMGNRALTHALASISTEHFGVPPNFKHVFLAAPDIDVDVFKQLALIFPSNAARVTLYASSNDKAIIASRKIHQYARVGDTGSITIVPQIDTIDATAVDTSLFVLGHSYFSDNRSVLSDIHNVIQTGDPPDKRFGMRPLPNGVHPTYWAFRP